MMEIQLIKRGKLKEIPDLWMAFVVLFWAINSPVLKILYTELDPEVFTVIRFIIISFLAFLFFKLFPNENYKRMNKKEWNSVLLAGFFSFVSYQYFLLNGLSVTPVFLASVLVSLSPLFAVIISFLLGIEKASLKNVIGIIISLIGIIIFQQDELSNISFSFQYFEGQAYCLAAALSWALYTIVTKRKDFISVPQRQSFMISVSFGTSILLILFFTELINFDYNKFNFKTSSLTAYTVIFPIFIAYRLYNKSVAKMGIERTIVFVYLVPIFSGLIAALIGLDDFTLQKLFASIIVIAGVILAKMK